MRDYSKDKDLWAMLAAERERRRDAERRLATHSVRAAESNSALARNNSRLQEIVARLRGELDALAHDTGCQRAAAAAREQLAAQELSRLRAQLQRAEAEQAALRRQVDAKQGIISYLESKLDELQSRSRAQSPAPAAAAEEQPPSCRAGEALDTATAAAAAVGDERCEPDTVSTSGGCSLSVLDWARAAQELEERERDLAELESGAAVQADSCGAEVGCGEQAVELPWDEVACSQALEATCCPLTSGRQQHRQLGCTWDEEGGLPASHAATAATAAGAAEAVPALGSGLAVAAAGGALGAEALTTPVRRSAGKEQGSADLGSAAPRSSLRTRNTNVSYAEPSLRSKLRQGDPHTFGAAEADAVGALGGSQRPRARAKPRPVFATGPARLESSSLALMPATD